MLWTWPRARAWQMCGLSGAHHGGPPGAAHAGLFRVVRGPVGRDHPLLKHSRAPSSAGVAAALEAGGLPFPLVAGGRERHAFCPRPARNAIPTLEVACGFWAPQGAVHHPPPPAPLGPQPCVSGMRCPHRAVAVGTPPCSLQTAQQGRPRGRTWPAVGVAGAVAGARLRGFHVLKNKEPEAANSSEPSGPARRLRQSDAGAGGGPRPGHTASHLMAALPAAGEGGRQNSLLVAASRCLWGRRREPCSGPTGVRPTGQTDGFSPRPWFEPEMPGGGSPLGPVQRAPSRGCILLLVTRKAWNRDRIYLI